MMALTTGTGAKRGVGPQISCVIPVFHSAALLPEICRRLVTVFEIEGLSFEIVFVDDSGSGQVWPILKRLAQSDERVKGICLNRNYGQHNALLCGIREARGTFIVTMDDDLQHPPEEIPKLLARFDQNCDVVYGPPKVEQHGLLRNFASVITKSVFQNWMGKDSARHISAFRAFRTELRDVFSHCQNSNVNIDVLLAWSTQRFAVVPVRHDPRSGGKSGYTLGMLIRHALNMMTGFSVLPLQLASFLGLFFACFGFVLLAYVLAIYCITGSAVPGFTFLASIVALFSGVQLFSIGIIGEYLARIYDRTMDRPVYSVRATTDTTHAETDTKP